MDDQLKKSSKLCVYCHEHGYKTLKHHWMINWIWSVYCQSFFWGLNLPVLGNGKKTDVNKLYNKIEVVYIAKILRVILGDWKRPRNA